MLVNMIAIINYQMGNLFSVANKVSQLGFEARVTSDPQDIAAAEKLILPGVGHFGRAMEELNRLDLVGPLNTAVLEKKTPILGICLGMQLMASFSEEGDSKGLGWFEANVKRFVVDDSVSYKIPHTGWNGIILEKESALTTGLGSGAEFYFVHSYFFEESCRSDRLMSTDFETRFTSAVSKENIYGVQFHPEKSHRSGVKLISNFLKL